MYAYIFTIAPQVHDPNSDIQLLIQACKTLGKKRAPHVTLARDFTSITIPVGGYSIHNNDYHIHAPYGFNIGSNANNNSNNNNSNAYNNKI